MIELAKENIHVKSLDTNKKEKNKFCYQHKLNFTKCFDKFNWEWTVYQPP